MRPCPSTPGLVSGAAPPELTPREREIALLAVRGLTAKEIAELLVLSPRTVENHLEHAYTKLGISGRRDRHDSPSHAAPPTTSTRPPSPAQQSGQHGDSA